MRDEERTPGFSFQLSASAPPAEVSLEAPQAPYDVPGEPYDVQDEANDSLADEETRTPAPALVLRPVTTGAAPASAAGARPAPTPAIKRISFPRRAPASRTVAPPSSPGAAAAASPSATVFSPSVSQAPQLRGRAPLDSDPLDSDGVDSHASDVLDAPSPAAAPLLTAPSFDPFDADPPWNQLQGPPLTPAPGGTADGDDPDQDDPDQDDPGAPASKAAARPRSATRAAELWVLGASWSQQGARSLLGLARRGAAFSWAAGEQALRTVQGRARTAWTRRREPLATLPEEGFSTVESTPVPPTPGTPRLRPPALPSLARVRQAVPAVAALAAAGACYVAVSQLVPDGSVQPGAPEAAVAGPPAAADPASASPADAAPAPSSNGAPAAATSAAPVPIEQLPLPDGLGWPGKGLIEVVTAGRELIYVDGVFTGRGPLRRIPVTPGSHEVVLRTETSERRQAVDVVLDRRARLVFGGAAGESVRPSPGSPEQPTP